MYIYQSLNTKLLKFHGYKKHVLFSLAYIYICMRMHMYVCICIDIYIIYFFPYMYVCILYFANARLINGN